MILVCCEKCAKMAKKNNPAFDIGMPVFIMDAENECDICGEDADLLLCEDPDDERGETA